MSQLHEGDSVESLVKILRSSLKNMLETAATMLVRLFSEDPQVMEKVVEAYPVVTLSMLQRLLRVGEGTLAPELFFRYTSGAIALRRLPMTVQTQVLKKGAVDVAEGDSFRRVDIDNLSPEQCRQVFGLGTVRSLDEQRAFARAAAALPVTRSKRKVLIKWRAQGDSIVVTKPVELVLSSDTLEEMLQALRKKS